MTVASKPKSENSKPIEYSEDGVSLVVERALFYREQSRSLTKILMLSSAALLVMLILIIFMFTIINKKDKEYFAVSNSGSVIKMYPLKEPTVSDTRLLQIVGDASACVYNYDYVNYREQLSKCRTAFTSNGWLKFTSAIKDSKVLEIVERDKLVVSAVKSGAPIILDTGIVNGRLAWQIQTPITVNYESRTGRKTDYIVVTSTVVRADQSQYSDGIAIDSTVSGQVSANR